MKPVLTLTPTTEKEMGGLIIFELSLWADGEVKRTWLVNSGQPSSQRLLSYEDPKSYSGDQRPIPEAVYRIGPLEFAGGAFDWADSWGPGLGDFWAAITRIVGGEFADTIRRAFGFHWDENRRRSPGSLGCIVFATKQDVEDFVEWMRRYDPRNLIVDYGFGTVPKVGDDISPPLAAAKKRVEIVSHSGKLKMKLDGTWIHLDSLKISADWQ